MYWTHRSLPELADLPNKERDAIWREARRDPFRVTDLAWFTLFMLVNGGMVLCFVPFMSKSGWINAVAYAAVILVGDRVMSALMVLRYRPVVRRLRHSG